MGDRPTAGIQRCSSCGAEHEQSFMTCPECGDWLNERRFYA